MLFFRKGSGDSWPRLVQGWDMLESIQSLSLRCWRLLGAQDPLYKVQIQFFRRLTLSSWPVSQMRFLGHSSSWQGIYLSFYNSQLKKKKEHNLKAENYVLFHGQNLSSKDGLSALKGCSEKSKGRARIYSFCNENQVVGAWKDYY